MERYSVVTVGWIFCETPEKVRITNVNVYNSKRRNSIEI